MSALKPSVHFRMIALLKGNQSLSGALAIAVAGKQPDHPPRIVQPGRVTEDGVLVVCVESRANPGYAKWCPLGYVDQIRDEFRKYADTLGFTDAEHLAWFDAFRSFIAIDDREREGPLLH